MTKSNYLFGRNRRALSTCSALTALLISMPAMSQDAQNAANDEEPFRLGTLYIDAGAFEDNANIIVAEELWVGGKVATRLLDTPASVSVITQREIEERQSDTVEEVLQYTPGVHTDYFGGDDRNDYYLIRGFQATTYRDGLTLGSMRGVREEPFAYERIEVLRGANSTLFGPADPGGSVNFVSKTPKFTPFFDTYATYGSFDRKEVGFDVGGPFSADSNLAYRFTGKLRDSDRQYDFSKDDIGFLMGGLTWEPTVNTSLTIVADYLNRDDTPNSGGYPIDREYSRSSFFGEPGYNFHDVDRTSFTGLFTHDFDNGFSLNANIRYSDLSDDFAYTYLFDTPGRTGTVVPRFYFGMDDSAEELIGNVILKYDGRIGPFDSSTLAGIELREASTTSLGIFGSHTPIDVANPVYTGGPASTSAYTDVERDFSTQAVFFQQNLSFDDRWILTYGARHDWLALASTENVTGAPVTASDDFSETSLRGAVTYKFNEQISAYASYVESVAPPVIGIEPERGNQVEFGVKYSPPGMNALFSASVYELNRTDVTIPVVQPSGLITREVIGKNRVRGFDFEAKAEITDNFSVVGGYSYMDTEVVEGTLRDGTSIAGNEFVSIPNHMASVWGSYTFPEVGGRAGDLTFGLGARYISEYYFDAANTSKSDAAIVFDASISYEVFEDTNLTVFASNLFNEQHVVGQGTANYYNPGRQITLTLKKSW